MKKFLKELKNVIVNHWECIILLTCILMVNTVISCSYLPSVYKVIFHFVLLCTVVYLVEREFKFKNYD